MKLYSSSLFLCPLCLSKQSCLNIMQDYVSNISFFQFIFSISWKALKQKTLSVFLYISLFLLLSTLVQLLQTSENNWNGIQKIFNNCPYYGYDVQSQILENTLIFAGNVIDQSWPFKTFFLIWLGIHLNLELLGLKTANYSFQTCLT